MKRFDDYQIKLYSRMEFLSARIGSAKLLAYADNYIAMDAETRTDAIDKLMGELVAECIAEGVFLESNRAELLNSIWIRTLPNQHFDVIFDPKTVMGAIIRAMEST